MKTITLISKLLALLAYVPIFGIIVAYFLNNENKHWFTSFHIRQALGLWLLYFVIALSIRPIFTKQLYIAFWIAFGTLLLFAIATAILGISKPIPFLGKLFQKWFKSI